MATNHSSHPTHQPSSAAIRGELAFRLQARRIEIEQALLTRAYAIQQPTEISNPAYAEGLGVAVSAGVSYALAGIETGDPQPGPVPAELLVQAQLAAQENISLDTVLRRYLLGHTLLGDFLISESERVKPFKHEALQELLRVQAMLADRLIATIADEYTRATQSRLRTTEQRRANQVKRLLTGELLDPAQLEYDFELCHLGLVAVGPGAEEEMRGLTSALAYRRLLVAPRIGTAWAWLGASTSITPVEVLKFARANLSADIALAIGEPGRGLAGWRLTHRQAEAAMPIAKSGTERVVRYTDVALLASALRDEVLAASLQDTYLAPLAASRDGGDALRQTLHAYFAAGRNASSAAAELRVSRQTVNERLRRVEEKLARQIDDCAPELETALSLQALPGA